MSSPENITFIQNPKHDVDRQINAKLVEIWNKNSMGWSEKMRNNFREAAAAAQVTEATKYVSSHKIYRRMRGRPITQAEYTVLAVIFGTIAVRRLDCMGDFENEYPNPEFYAGIMTPDLRKKLKLKQTSMQSLQNSSNQEENQARMAPHDGTTLADATIQLVIETGERIVDTPSQTRVPETSDSEAEMIIIPPVKATAESRENRPDSQVMLMTEIQMDDQIVLEQKTKFFKVEGAESQSLLELPADMTEMTQENPQDSPPACSVECVQEPSDFESQSLSKKRPHILDDIWEKIAKSPRKKSSAEVRIETLESHIKRQDEEIKQQADKIEKLARYVASYLAESPD
ncbi:hypothetical protein E4U55_005269 [Claviceps digitariae]|nr:hypothetical protein E4U55_005269 [Claviceps digitariae]